MTSMVTILFGRSVINIINMMIFILLYRFSILVFLTSVLLLKLIILLFLKQLLIYLFLLTIFCGLFYGRLSTYDMEVTIFFRLVNPLPNFLPSPLFMILFQLFQNLISLRLTGHFFLLTLTQYLFFLINHNHPQIITILSCHI